MAWITSEIDTYWFRIHAQRETVAATIYCKKGAEWVGTLVFMYGEEKTSAKLSDSNTPILTYPASMLATVLEILRVEKPLYLHIEPTIPWGYIGSGREPVGEEE